MTVSPEEQVATPELSRDLRRRAILITAGFAALWGLVGASGASPAAAAAVMRVAAVVVSAVLVLVALRRDRPLSAERIRHLPEAWRRQTGLVNLGEVAAIAAVVVPAVALDVPEVVPPGVCLIVGLHFVPLARLFDQPELRWTAVAMVVAAAAGAIVLASASPAPSRVVTGFGAALALWATAAALGFREPVTGSSSPTTVTGR